MELCRWSESDNILEVAKFLIANGIDINQKDAYYPMKRGFNISESKKEKIL